MIRHMKGHKNSKGEKAEWVIVSHETGKILSSHKSKEKAKEHMRQMKIFKENRMNLTEAKQILKANGYKLNEFVEDDEPKNVSNKELVEEIKAKIKSGELNAGIAYETLLKDEVNRLSQYTLRKILFDNKWILQDYAAYYGDEVEDISDSDVPSLGECRNLFWKICIEEIDYDEILNVLIDAAAKESETNALYYLRDY